MDDDTDKTEFWANIGEGIAILLLCIGIGGCNYLADKNSSAVDIEMLKVKQLQLELKLKEEN